MQTLTIKIDDGYLNQVLNFLKKIPNNKLEIFYNHDKNTPDSKQNYGKKNLLKILKSGPTFSGDEIREWEENITNGYKTWTIEAF